MPGRTNARYLRSPSRGRADEAREQELRKRARVARELRESCASVARELRESCASVAQELSKSKSCARVAQELSKSKPRSWGGGGAKEEANNTTPLR